MFDFVQLAWPAVHYHRTTNHAPIFHQGEGSGTTVDAQASARVSSSLTGLGVRHF